MGCRVAILSTVGVADGNTGEDTLVADQSTGSLGFDGGAIFNTACIAEESYAFKVTDI